MLTIPPPPPYDLIIDDLTIGFPPSRRSLIPQAIFSKLLEKKANGSDGEKMNEDGPPEESSSKKGIIRNVSGRCEAGEVLAIIGGSGSGKTTLLNLIANRLGSTLPTLSGSIVFRSAQDRLDSTSSTEVQQKSGQEEKEELKGEHSDQKLLKEVGKRIGYVKQSDFLLPHLTVRETLRFAAALRLPTSVSKSERELIVEQTIQELGLKDAAETVVGGASRKGISGGEKRRLSIGCVLVTLPSILVLDEPTSGLDAFTSHLLLETLSQLAKRNRTVVLSLHAPRSDAFGLFDKLLLLSKGNVVYSGPTHKSLPWFERCGWTLEAGTNPLDFMIDISSVDNRDSDREDESLRRVKKLVDAWKASSIEYLNIKPVAPSHDRSPECILKEDRSVEPVPSLTRSPVGNELSAPSPSSDQEGSNRPGWWLQTGVLTKRAHLNVYRNWSQLIGFAVQAIVIGALMGFTFFRLGETVADVQSMKNISFQLVPAYFYLTQVYWIFNSCNALIIFDREREDGLYGVIPYVVSEFLSNLLPSILAPSIYVILVYTMAGLRDDDYAANLFTIVASSVIVQWATQGLALFSASVLRPFAQASVICNALSLFQTMSAGFLLVNVPPWVSWIRWTAPQFYSYRIVAPTLLRNRTFSCPGVVGVELNQCDGNKVLVGLKINNVNIGVYFAGLIGVALVEYSLACLILQVYHPGGVKFASQVSPEGRGKESAVTGDMDISRARINVEVRHISLSWYRRSFWPFFESSNKTILKDISAVFPAGQVSAIIGPSGAGKSTVLQLLSHRHLNAGSLGGFKFEGSLLYNGGPATKEIKAAIAFVEQDDDYHLSGLTVRETLRYAAILRLPNTMSRKNKLARAEEVLLMLGLKDCANVLVGGALVKGISGGEKRRLSLAVQMINDPSILIVDEPTSGLDAFIANNVMQCLTDIAHSGRTVIATIHQPRSDIVKAFDNLCVLAKGGAVVFSGPNVEAIPWFEAHGFPLQFGNPADHILDVISIDSRPGKEDESRERVNGLIDSWKDRTTKSDIIADRASIHSDDLASEAAEVRMTPFYVALPTVLHRMVLNLYRQRDAFWNRLSQAPLLGVLFLIFYTRLKREESGAQDRIGITAENVNAMPFVGLLNGIAIFPQDRNLFFHEYRSSATYSAFTFIVAYTFFELSMTVFASFFYGLLMNVAVGLQTSYRIYIEFCVSIWAILSFGESISICLASFASETGLAVSYISTVLAVFCQISGIISLSVPNWLAGIAWVTPLKAATKIQFINEARNLTFSCSPESIESGACVATSGNDLLISLGFYDLNTEKFVGILVATAIGWRGLSWLALRLKLALST
ncbi:Pleiotropic drug resistance proteins (PDR1-15), ABC superfamily [Phaffia rhodozyma]|uniref:Pleiotropic drug resistance proteins (PDR1-15), ABC superfamily n=1 Tax=Phaffia rhodozyma TaxID=264483 RepID=A0A0F7SH15_PHARH|nr:Pleiotropic drug resistance proteins (PDR1-15), ABC superfamily [Phaffia rhodozyma]